MTRSALLHRLAGVAWVVGFAVALGLLIGTGGMVQRWPIVSIVVAVGILAIGLTLVEPATIPLLVMPALLVVKRVGAGDIDLSFSDFALFVSFWPALFLGKRPYSRPMRNLLWLSILYQVSTMFTILVNPYRANAVEWFHAWLLVSGALVVGWTIARAGYARLSMNLLVVASLGLAAIAIIQGLRQYAHGNFDAVYPTWPYPMHKNFVGTVLGFSAAISYARPTFVGWTRRWSLIAFWISVTGILVCQSRQALIGLGVALLLIVVRTQTGVKRSKVIVLAISPALAMAGFSVKDQVKSGNEFNSVFQRLTWIQDSMGVWAHNPVFGVGLRWWYTERFDVSFQPPNAEIEVLTSAGVVGLAGFILLMVGAVVVLWRVDRGYGTVAVAVLLSRLVQSQLDLFWIAVQTSVPFVVAGISLGAHALAHEEDEELRALESATHRVGSPA
jgi:hypothetical protein